MAYFKCPHQYCGSGFQSIERDNYDGTYQCKACGTILYVKIWSGVVQEVRELRFPIASLSYTVPEEVANDFNEAVKCFNVGAYKAAVVMCRRSLESTADLKNAEGKNLSEKIKDLYQNGLLDEATYHIASGIRQFGNYGAHPKDDVLKVVGELEAEIILKLTNRLLAQIFR